MVCASHYILFYICYFGIRISPSLAISVILIHKVLFISFSTPPRIYRQVATLIGLQVVTTYISVGKTLIQQRETTQRQLNAEKKKGNDGPRVESLNRRLQATHEKINALEEMMRKVFTG